MISLLIIFLIIVILLSFFIFPQLSPIPYFPSNKKDLFLIIKALDLKNRQTIIDLGAGDGLVIFEAAKTAFEKNFKTNFIAVEINPVLILILYIKRFFHPNKKRIKIVKGNMFEIKLKSLNKNTLVIKKSNNPTIYLYISPWYLSKVIKNLKLEIRNFHVVSYMYPLPKIKPNKIIKGKNKIFIYKNTFY